MLARPRAAALTVLVLLFACGASQQDQALSYAFTGLRAANEGFIAYDADRQRHIVAEATSLEDGQAKLQAYRARREKYLQALIVAGSALTVAALDPTPANLLAAGAEAKKVYDAVKILTGGP